MNRITFTKPPLLEAVCIFEFASEQEWNWTIPGLFFARIEDGYVVEKRKSSKSSEDDNSLEPLRFRSKDKRFIVNVGPNGLSVNHLRPYVKWEEYKAEVERILTCYWDAAHPKEIEDVSLRYINRFEMPEGEYHYDEFLRVAPMLPPGKRDMRWLNWGQKVDVWCDDISSVLSIKAGTLQFRRKKEEEPQDAVMLELIVSHGTPEPLQKEAISDWLEAAHTEIKKTFMDSLTELSKETVGYKELNDETEI